MSRRRTLTRAGNAAAATFAACAAAMWTTGVGAPPAAPPASMTLADSAVSLTSPAATTGEVATAKTLTIQVWLRPELAAAEAFATAVSTPGNRVYRSFLSPDGYTARFGPTAQEASAVGVWLRSRGFTAVAADTQRDYVRGTATVARIEAARRTTIKQYPGAGQTDGEALPRHAQDGSLAVPASVAPDVLGVTGLNNAVPIVPSTQRRSWAGLEDGASRAGKRGSCSRYWGQRMLSGLPAKFGTRTFPEVTCAYSGAQYRSAYGADSANIGRGQTIAFTEPGGLEPDMFQTLKDFAKENGLPAPASDRYEQINQQPASCKKQDESRGEEQMDLESAYTMAPDAKQLVVGGDVCDTADGGFQGGFDTDLAIIDGDGQKPLASVVSNSWETGYDDQAKNVNQIETAFLVKAAAVGVGMYYAAGDSACVTQPSSNPYATGVGSTTLAIDKSGRRLFETGNAIGSESIKHNAWDKTTSYFGLGGGQSLLYTQPGYQKGVVPAAMNTPPKKGKPAGQAGCRHGGPPPREGTSPMRSAPDVSASDGNFSVGILTKGEYTHVPDGDTSLSAPLVAGMVIAAQQGQARPFGFLNPALYRLAGTSAFYDPLPMTRRDPVLWRAEVCPKIYSLCGGPTELWLTDDQSGSERGYTGQVTAKGYDNTTGIGVPNGQHFITALRRLG